MTSCGARSSTSTSPLHRAAEIIEVNRQFIVCRDPRDDKFLALAVCGRSEVLISGDKDLLVLHPFQDISILSPADFMQQAASE